MGTDADVSSKPSSNFVLEALNGENGIEESSMLMEMLTRINIDLAYSSEKLTNLDIYMAIVSLGESRLGEFSEDIEIEKALIFDLSLCFVESEITALKYFLNVLKAEIINSHNMLQTLWKKRETFTTSEGKLHASECSLNNLIEQVSGLERHLSIMRGTPYGQQNTFLYENVTSESSVSDLQSTGQQRLVLRMLDKSLSGQLDLENQLLHSKEREEELKSKLLTTNMFVSDMDSFVEVAIEKILVAEHSSEVYMGITKEMMTHLQILQFQTHCSVQREEELKSKLQCYLQQLKEKETSSIDIEKKALKEKEKLEEKVKKLEEILCVSEAKLQEVNEELSLMDNTVESLREHAFNAETRAQRAEIKLTTLTEENIELKEELTFLKDGDDNVEKISLLDKHVRDLEVQLQSAKASSEASLEQQNMLYTAIWDMETLIEELRSKVSRGESRADSAENQCLSLAETNITLNNEIRYLKNEIEKLQRSLKVSNEMTVTRVNDVNCGANIITEMAVELASERVRIQRQLSALAKENKILLEELRKMRKIVFKVNQSNKESNVNDSGAVVDDSNTSVTRAIATIPTVQEALATQIFTAASNQVDDTVDQNIAELAKVSTSSITDSVAENIITNDETRTKKIIRRVSKKYYTSVTIIILLLSILAMNINWQDVGSLIPQQYLGL